MNKDTIRTIRVIEERNSELERELAASQARVKEVSDLALCESITLRERVKELEILVEA